MGLTRRGRKENKDNLLPSGYGILVQFGPFGLCGMVRLSGRAPWYFYLRSRPAAQHTAVLRFARLGGARHFKSDGPGLHHRLFLESRDAWVLPGLAGP